MDNITHSLFALTLARTSLGRNDREATVALVLASNAPDIDIVTTVHGTLGYLHWHRGPTHGPLGVVVLGLITAALVRGGRRLFERRDAPLDQPRLSVVTLASLSMLAVLFHILMDLPTSYGTRLFSPFNWDWYTTDWMPIVDIYLIVAMAAGLYFGRRSETVKRWNTALVLTLMVVNYSVRAVAHERALALAPRLFGPTLPEPCDTALRRPILARWPTPSPTQPAPGAVRCLVEIAAMPTLVSPFEWRIIAQMSNGYDVQDVNLLDRRFQMPPDNTDAFWRRSTRVPNQWTPATFRASSTQVGREFLGFCRFPSARVMGGRRGSTVSFEDVRFMNARLVPGPAPGPGRGRGAGRGVPPRPLTLFAATVQFDANGDVVNERMGP